MMEKTREEICVALLLLLTSVLASASVEVQPSANTATVGDTVTLSLVPPTALRSGSWAVGDALVITWLGEQQAVFPSHSGRASVDIGSGALTLSAVTVADSGVYVVQGSDPPLRASAAITVVEIVSNVTLSMNQTALTEAKSSAILRCSVSSGSSLSFLWLNSSSEVTASDRVHTTDEGSTLIIIGVTRYDQGPFRCHAFNPVSNGTSDAVNFVISYGPDNMALTVNGNGTTSFPSGSNLTMLCSAHSSPPAELGWAIRGEFVSKGPLLEVFGVTEEQTGPYTCRAFNNHTNLSSTITKHILNGDVSGAEQQSVCVWFLPMLLLSGLL